MSNHRFESSAEMSIQTSLYINKTQSSCDISKKKKFHFPFLKSDDSISIVVFPYVVKMFKISFICDVKSRQLYDVLHINRKAIEKNIDGIEEFIKII